MTDKTKEALKLALEAICGSGDFLFNWHDCEPNNEREMQQYQATLAANEKAFRAIREALVQDALDKKAENARELGLDYEPAQPQQEPVAWIDMREWPPIRWRDGMLRKDVDQFDGQGLFLFPPAQRKPLTDEMVVAAARMLSDRQAAACNVDCGDMWKMHGNDFIEDARAALEAAHGIKGDA